MSPLFGDFEGAGVAEALQRGAESMKRRLSGVDVPDWLTDLNFARAVHKVSDVWYAGEVTEKLRNAENKLRALSAERAPWMHRWKTSVPGDNTPAIPAWGSESDDAQKTMVIALARMQLGAAVEASFCADALDLCAPGARALGDIDLPRLYQDAFLVATYTSAHAHFVTLVQSGVEEPPAPSIHSVANSCAELDFSDLFCRRSCPRMCPKPALPLLQILQRATNPGSRGWNTLLESALVDSMPARTVVSNALVVALSAMHPYIHPALRPPWALRMRAQRVAQHKLTDSEIKAMAVSTAAPTKEAMRRFLASTVAAVPAMREALAHVGHPIGLLKSPPLEMPARGLEAAMAAFCSVGITFALSAEVLNYASTVTTSFNDRCADESMQTVAVECWRQPWLGKGTAAVHSKIPLTNLASEIWSMGFRQHFSALWAHCHSRQLRCSRLDVAQYRALHELNEVTRLTLQLSTDDQLQTQRAALQHVSAGLLTLEEAGVLLNVKGGVRGSSINGGTKSPTDCLRALSSGGAHATARLFVFARAAWVSESLLIVELGERSKRLQKKALFHRYKRAEDYHEDADVFTLPVHATHLHACIECSRVATAFSRSDAAKSGDSFRELGVSSSMLTYVSSPNGTTKSHIRCAKRSSAALRTALAHEESMSRRAIESEKVDIEAVKNLMGSVPVELSQAKSGGLLPAADSQDGISARVRRDAKNSLEQRATAMACGDAPMLSVPIFGRAVRVFGDWYGLCSFCGCCLRILPHNRFEAEICCLRCDPAMLGVAEAKVESRPSLGCRYCGKIDLSSRWKTIKAPLDVSGANACLPPPLRVVVYCPSHTRQWQVAAHRSLQTRVILSHIAHGAKPLANPNGSEKMPMHLELGLAERKKAKKRPRKCSDGPRNEGE